MITITIHIKETDKNAMAMSFDPVLDNPTELEDLAGKVFMQECWKAFEMVQKTGADHLDIQGDAALEYRKRIFGK